MYSRRYREYECIKRTKIKFEKILKYEKKEKTDMGDPTYIQLGLEALKIKQNNTTDKYFRFPDIKANLIFLLKLPIFVPGKITLEGSRPKYIKVKLLENLYFQTKRKKKKPNNKN